MTLLQVAEAVNGSLTGDGSRVVRGVAPVDEAGPEELAFVASARYAPYLFTTRAAAVLVDREVEVPAGCTAIRVESAHAALAAVLPLLYPPPPRAEGVHPTAVVENDVQLGEGVALGAHAVVQRGSRIGPGTQIGPNSVVGAGCAVGAQCTLAAHVTLYPGVVLGDRCVVHSGARIGSEGFGYVWTGGEHRKVPQVGGCRIGDDVEIGSNTTIDRGSVGDTTIGRGSKIDNLVQIGHNTRVGEHVIIISQVGVSGSCVIGDGAVLAGQAGVGGHLRIGAGARVAGQAGVIGDVEAGQTVSGYPARPHREALRSQALLFRLPQLWDRLRRLEKTVSGRSAAASPPSSTSGIDSSK